MPRPDPQDPSVKDALVDAAARLLDDRAPEDVSLREVARRAGVSHAAPYHHFPSKAALLAEVARQGFLALDRSMAEAQAAAPVDGRAQLLACGVGYYLFSRRHRAVYQLMMERPDMCDHAEGGGLEEAGQAAFARLVAAVATTRHEAGLTDDEGVLPDAFLCWSLVHGCSSLLANGQAKRHAPTPDDELRLVRALLERNHALFAPPRPRA